MEIQEKKIKDLIPYEKNPRKNDAAVEYVANSIKEFGFKVPIVIDRNGVIVCGHTRYKAAQRLMLKTVPCIIADDLSDEQIKAFRLADNRVSEKSEWDFDLLYEELDGIFDIDMEEFDFDILTEFTDIPEKAKPEKRIFEKENFADFDPKMTEGEFQMPILKPSFHIPKKLIGFNYVRTSTEYTAGVHFYLDDYQFERMWNNPFENFELLSKFDCCMTPNFSIYLDFPEPLKIYNTFRSRLLGQMMQRYGLEVIPIAYWSDERSYKYCFDGLPEEAVLSVNTIGNKDKYADELWNKGMDELIKRKNPKTLLVYGNGIKPTYDFKNTEVIYFENDVTQKMKKIT